MSNLKKRFCHRSYLLWKKDLNGLTFNPQSLREWVNWDREKWVVYWCMPLFLSVMLFWFLYFLFSFLSFFHYTSLLSFFSPLNLLFTATTFYTICHGEIYHFYPLTTFGFLWAFFWDYPLACRLLSHYYCLSYFLPFYVFHYSHLDKD